MKRFALGIMLISTLTNTTNAYSKVNERTELLESEKNTISVFKENVHSVVNVSTIKVATRGLWWLEGNSQKEKVPQGAGSGFLWDDKGHIVTNYHVIRSGDEFAVNFHNDKKQYKAKLVYSVPQKDIAVLKLIDKPKSIRPIRVGRSKDLIVGQKAMAIGNPFGLDHTMTSGIISALNRKIDGVGGVKIQGMIQTDTSINPGNSGGPLLDSSGNLIGMNTAIYSASGSSAGIGFAVPVDTITSHVNQIIKHGKIIRPALGISLLSDYNRHRAGIEKGVIIESVQRGSAAEKAGLRGIEQDRRGRYYLGDIIIKVGSFDIDSYDDIYNALENFKINQTVRVKIIRDDKPMVIKIKLQETIQWRKKYYKR